MEERPFEIREFWSLCTENEQLFLDYSKRILLIYLLIFGQKSRVKYDNIFEEKLYKPRGEK